LGFRTPNLPDEPSKLSRNIRRQLRQTTLIVKATQLAVGAILPIVEGVLINLVTREDELGRAFYETLPFVVLVGVVVIHAFFLVMLLLIDTPLPQFLVEFDEQARLLDIERIRVREYRRTSDTFTFATTAAEFSLEEIARLRHHPASTLRDTVERVMHYWVDGRSEIFWFHEGTALYNFAVYMYSSTTDELSVLYRAHDDRIQVHNRSWKPGQGHVGLCFVQNTSSYWNVPENPANIPTMLLSPQHLPTDRKYYNCFIATPILIEDQKQGILIVTSNNRGQFEETVHIPILRLMSALLTQAMEDWRRNHVTR
jgi:hypothetical protein